MYFVDPRALWQRMHLVDLATGKERVFPFTSHPWSSPGAAVGPHGLVYTANTYGFGAKPLLAGTLVFVSTARTLSMIAHG